MRKNSHSLATLASEFVQYFVEIKSEGFIQCSIPTFHGLVDLAAEIEILDNGATLHFKDVVIYPQGKSDLKNLVPKEMLKVRTELLKAADVLGFKNVRMTAKRHESSTSANPGHKVERFLPLKKVTKDAEIK